MAVAHQDEAREAMVLDQTVNAPAAVSVEASEVPLMARLLTGARTKNRRLAAAKVNKRDSPLGVTSIYSLTQLFSRHHPSWLPTRLMS